MDFEYRDTRRMILRILATLSVFLLGYLIFGSLVCDLTFRSGGKRISSLTQFHNLKTEMSHYTAQFYDGDFPDDIEELTQILKRELGLSDLGDGKPIEHTITDAWDKELKLEGDIEGYTIRSAGPDGLYETGDDITIKGNQWGENVFDGTNRRKVTLKSIQRRINRLPFQDPTGYYEVYLPGAYKVIDEFAGGDSEIRFQYSPQDFIKITAGPDSQTWIPETEMLKRLEEIKGFKDPDLSGMRLIRSGLVSIEGGEGFEIRMEDESNVIHEFRFVSGYYMRVRVWISSMSKDRSEIIDYLETEIESRLIIH